MNIFKYIEKAIVFGLALFCFTLAFQSPSYAAALKGKWKLESLGGVPVVEDTQITATFEQEPDGVISGSAGCNRYFGSFKSDSGNITFGTIATTKMFCGGESIMEQEAKYVRALESATSYDVTDQSLKIIYGSDNQVLKYVKAD